MRPRSDQDYAVYINQATGLVYCVVSSAFVIGELAGLQRAQHLLDAAGFARMGELEYDIKEREKKRTRYGR